MLQTSQFSNGNVHKTCLFIRSSLCVDLACDWSIVFRSFHTRARPASPPNRACIARGRWDPDVRVQCVCSSGGGRAGAACAFLARSMATDPRVLARLGVHPPRACVY